MNDLLTMTKSELLALTEELGVPAYRASQIMAHVNRGEAPHEMTTLPLSLRTSLAERTVWRLPTVERKQVSQKDGTVKYLMRLFDGECVESVLMSYKHGYSLCISCQVGCRMGCRFCASTLGGRVRNLYASEMLGQVVAAQKDAGVRVASIVMMGIGEPLDNYDETVKFLHRVTSPESLHIGARHISLSSCGLVPAIRRLAEENLAITLSISLHAATDEARSEIMPINRKYGLDELLTAASDYFRTTGRRISFEYTLLAGKNDTDADAERLASLLHRYLDPAPIHVNLIRVNEVEETEYRHGTKKSAEAFAYALQKRGVNATLRRRLGDDVDAACGQLRRKSQKM
ncbi:MAG: 23S rRNA (adenine(2503)-C(2))-methyltransferase RlmN [Clostridia bacterium]|nr:23S rRNA (adenine(2503)-C(2))-methyltransferase RlmN [Clostridia bacterium]